MVHMLFNRQNRKTRTHKIQPRQWLFAVVCLFAASNSQATLNVFACEPEWAALAKELGGEQLNIFSATTSMQDPHFIQARPSLIAQARRADLLVCTGADLEIGWLPLLLRKAANNNILPGSLGHFFAADFVNMLEIPTSIDRRHGHVHGAGNPHIHTSPENMLRVAEALTKRLIKLDAVNQVYYQKNFATFEAHWQQSIKRWQQQTEVLQGINIISHHRYWSYFNAWTGMQLVATLEPIPGVSPGSAHLASLKKRVLDKDVKMIIHVAYVNNRPARWLSERTGLPVLALPATVDFQSGESLTSWFDNVVNKLVAVVKE